jgi:hypothetical protein
VEWSQTGFDEYRIIVARRIEWEHWENEVIKGSKYKDLETVKEIVKLWSISLRKEFQVLKCSSSVYDVKCIHDGCPWRWKTHCNCSINTEHNCWSEVV